MKGIAIFILGICLVWLTHGLLLIRVSKLELTLKSERKELDSIVKELEKKEIEYDALVDLEKIGNEMRKANMAISNDIKFFTIEE